MKLLKNPIFWIVLTSFALRVFNLNYNSPFVDEAQYLVLGRKVLSGHWQEEVPFSWIGGMPLFYPTLSALAGKFGILGPRFLNVVLGTCAVYLIYQIGKKLKLSKSPRENDIVGYFSALLLGISAIPIHLSRLATYDILSFTLFLAGCVHLLSAYSFAKKRRTSSVKVVLSLSSFLFFLSFLAKYITFPYLALVLTVVLILSNKNKYLSRLVGNYFVLPLVTLTSLYIVWFFRNLKSFVTGQIIDVDVSLAGIAQEFFRYTLEYYALAILGVLFLAKRGKKKVAIGLLLGSFFTLVVHLGSKNIASVFQHTFLSLIFLVPLASYFFTEVYLSKKIVYRILVAILGAFILSRSLSTVRNLESSWPNTNGVMSFLSSRVGREDILLSQEGDISVLAVLQLEGQNVVGPFYFEYQGFTGEEAYKKAVTEGFFDYIQLTEGADEAFISMVKNSLGSNYELVYDSYPFLVYSKNAE